MIPGTNAQQFQPEAMGLDVEHYSKVVAARTRKNLHVGGYNPFLLNYPKHEPVLTDCDPGDEQDEQPADTTHFN